MSGLQKNFRKNIQPPSALEGLPASKRLKVGSEPEEDDPFAGDDITGEELEQWEFVASQAETKLTQERAKPQSILNNHRPNAGMTNGHSFKVPASNKTNATSSDKSLVKDLQAKLAIYEKKVKELEQSYKMKEGETMVLRDRLAMTEKSLNQEKMKILEVQNHHDLEEAEREKKAIKEIEKYKDQVQFKQVEILESQNLIKNLEAKNKLLEQKKPNTRISHTSSSIDRGAGFSFNTSSQDTSIAPAKKMRFIKPQSPRIQGSDLLSKPTFRDDPLGQKKSTRPLPSQPSSLSPCKVEKAAIHKPEGSREKLKLRSKHIYKDKLGQAMLRGLLSEYTIPRAQKKSTALFPFLRLFNSVEGNCSLDNLKNLLKACQGEIKVFGDLCSRTKSRFGSTFDRIQRPEDITGLLFLIDGTLEAFSNLQHSIAKGRTLSQDTSEYCTAPSAPLSYSAAEDLKPEVKCTPRPDLSSDTCQNALVAMQVLELLVSHSTAPMDSLCSKVPDLLSKVLKMQELNRWSPQLLFCEDILLISLRIVALLAKSSESTEHMTRFSPIMRSEIILPLVTHHNVDIKRNAIDELASLVRHPPFALVMLKDDSQSGLPSILCHICDLVCLEAPQGSSETAWLDLSRKIVVLLSVLTAEHEALLVEHSCFCEIYHAADVLLYNQLSLWKRDSEAVPTRSLLIKSALCLLHCCANVYPDGIPNSRRDHRHQFTLIGLEEFLASDGRQTTSFWSQELARIVNSEVKAIYDETESP